MEKACHCENVVPGLPSGHGGGDSLAKRGAAPLEVVGAS